jgi:flavin reductase (DIM6/NTAB) family NADH-FMN oxidoreductase RutF
MKQELNEIPLKKFQIRALELWATNWLLLTCGDISKGHYNSMTVAWGGIGIMWNLPIAMVVVRPTRYTFGFINEYPTFSLCAFPKEYKKALNLLGTKSGRDGDKISESGLTPTAAVKIAAPTYKEADLSIECKKIYFQDFIPEQFLDKRIEKQYPLNDYHRMVYGEIEAIRGDASLFSAA